MGGDSIKYELEVAGIIGGHLAYDSLAIVGEQCLKERQAK